MRIVFSFLCFLFLSAADLCAQENEPAVPLRNDSLPVVSKKTVTGSNRYDSAIKAHSPRKAAIRSAILPGLGQIYNKKYWKLPIVYGALGTCSGIFFYNLKNYKDTRFAYRVKYNMQYNGTDTALFTQIRDNLKPLDIESLKYYRNSFRRDIDYSALFFILLWGLNVVDATVDAHLKSFDVSPDLSLRFKPGYNEIARTSGLTLVLKIGK
ncbi:MAG: hypothetical protein HYZ15_09550 [Sphingobacteriales bacterium]|nr:hypothetical protein [Sphingobacteriales bacterium]